MLITLLGKGLEKGCPYWQHGLLVGLGSARIIETSLVVCRSVPVRDRFATRGYENIKVVGIAIRAWLGIYASVRASTMLTASSMATVVTSNTRASGPIVPHVESARGR